MIQVTFADRIRVPMWDMPKCNCSECILDPTTSHGIYTIGAYTVPSVLSRRGNHITPAHIQWQFTSNGKDACRGKSIEVHGVLDSHDQRAWFI